MNTKFQPERRKFPRKVFSDTPWLFTLVLSTQPNAEIPLRLEAKNISMGGMKFLSNQKIPLFEKIKLQIMDKHAKSDPIPFQAEVIRVEESDTGKGEKIFGIAIKFTALPKDSSPLLTVLSA